MVLFRFKYKKKGGGGSNCPYGVIFPEGNFSSGWLSLGGGGGYFPGSNIPGGLLSLWSSFSGGVILKYRTSAWSSKKIHTNKNKKKSSYTMQFQRVKYSNGGKYECIKMKLNVIVC